MLCGSDIRHRHPIEDACCQPNHRLGSQTNMEINLYRRTLQVILAVLASFVAQSTALPLASTNAAPSAYLSLASAIVDSSDIDSANWPLREPFADSYSVQDHTNELAGYCARDCVKHVWFGQGSTLTLIMIRMSSTATAERATANLFGLYSKLGENRFYPENTDVNARPGWSGEVVYWSQCRFQQIVTQPHGTVFVLFIHQRKPDGFVLDIDGGSYIGWLEAIMEVQVAKLERLGFKP